MSPPRDRDRLYKRSVGLLVIFSLLAALLMLRLYQQTAGPFRETFALVGSLPRGDGVAIDTPVTLAGIKVGRVTGVNLTDDNRVRIDLQVESGVRHRIREDSRATLVRPLLGTAFVDIGVGSAERRELADGDTIAMLRAADLNDLVGTLPARLEQIDAVLANLQALTADLRRSTAAITAGDGPLAHGAAGFAAAAEQAGGSMRRLNATLDEVHRVVGETGVAVRGASETIADVRELAAELKPLGPKAGEMAATLERSLHNVEAISADLRQMSPQLPPVLSAGQAALEDADDVLRAARNSFLLRGNLPPPAALPEVPVPR